MLMNDKIIFDRYYCINSAETKEIRCRNEGNMVHYILQPHHTFMLVPGGLQFLITSTCFAWRPVTSISKSHALTARARVNCSFLFINKRLLISCDMGIYAIIYFNGTR